MKHKFIENEICYTGKELSPHWIYKNHNIQGDAIVSFIGVCEVKLTEMVDIEDVLDNSPIYSKKMLHFIVEHFNMNLVEGILRQRLLVTIARDIILENKVNPNLLCRKGDDLFYNKGKLSVSIAAKSINSVLIHFGMNIDSSDAPVEAAGLKTEMNLQNFREIAEKIMISYCREYDEIINASVKVKGII
ncbi:MAG: hypothetical protein A2Y25_06615 [Candidatus Melainabacteria bacterium GWF2_37_15]|nr:MAG: hypothetical protein A2Y25_06615 [Candidatus Melainabacteria bacterium GWF2_37_15]